MTAFGAALLVGGLAGALAGGLGAGEAGTAGQSRVQLAVQAVAFALLALLLVEGLRLALPPRGRVAASVGSRVCRRAAVPALTVVAVGVAAAVGAYLVGPFVAVLAPELADPGVPVDDLGIGTGLGSDLGTVLVVVGLIPLGEELLFRGVLVGAWERAGRPAVGVIASTVLFGLAHVTVGPRTVLVAAVLGALFAAAFLVAGSLGAPVLAHTVVNAVALVEAGLDDPLSLGLLVVTVLVTTAVATKLSPLVSCGPPGDTLSS